MRPYAPRPLRVLGVESLGGFELRRWWIDLYEEAAPHPADWSEGLALAAAALPADTTPARPGVGFLILHRGRGADYLVLGWWDRENELPLRVFVRYPDSPDDARWRAARGGESVCVWDLEVVAREREIYVDTYLAASCPDAREAWLRHPRANGEPAAGAAPRG
jgi:hypothetical protein